MDVRRGVAECGCAAQKLAESVCTGKSIADKYKITGNCLGRCERVALSTHARAADGRCDLLHPRCCHCSTAARSRRYM
jgi:hypothetical protein